MVKPERNIHCTVCGKKNSDLNAAKKHIRKHRKTPKTPLVFVTPQPPGNVGAQSMADPNPNAGSIGVAYSSSSSQPTPPNLATHARLHATLGIPQVISPNIQGQSTMVDKGKGELSCPLCPQREFGGKEHLKNHKKGHKFVIINLERGNHDVPNLRQCTICSTIRDAGKMMEKHSRKEHGVRWSARQIFIGENRKALSNQNETIPDIPGYSLTESIDDEGELSLESGGQSSPEDKQQYPPAGKGKQPARDNWRSFNCDLCPETFQSAEILMMHTKAIHCWRCGYCPDLPPFSSLSLWREHRVIDHGLAGAMDSVLIDS